MRRLGLLRDEILLQNGYKIQIVAPNTVLAIGFRLDYSMSSGFVPGGTTENPIERDEDWLKAQQEIETARRRKEEQGRQENGKTLYDVLQNNKGD